MRKPPSEHSDVDDADLRVVFAADVVSQVLSKLAASLGRSVAKNVSLPGFPKHPLCSADVVVYPSSANAILRYDQGDEKYRVFHQLADLGRYAFDLWCSAF